MTAGRPLRFLAMVLGLWVGGRVLLLWPRIDTPAKMLEAIVPPVAALAIAPEPTPVVRGAKPAVARPPTILSTALSQNLSTGPTASAAIHRPVVPPDPPSPLAPPPPILLPERPPSLDAQPSRWFASGWLILRGGAPRADAPQLGGSQVGARIGYALDRHVALSLRAMAPLRGRGAEIATGLNWQPTRAPVHLLAERRIAVDGGRDGAGVMLVGGLDPTRLVGEWRIEAYGQAGVIARTGSSAEGFADGAARLSRPVKQGPAATLDLGMGLWGGVQRDAGRIDLGPSVALIVPAGERRLRFTLDWRQRVAGTSAPGSGPALSVGSDF